MSERKRALDMIKDIVEWKVFNPIYELNTMQFEKAFSLGLGIPKDYYVKHEYTGEIYENFEDKLCSDFFPPNHHWESRIYLIRGNPGVGKTSLIHYIGNDRLPELFPHSLFLHINCFSRFPKLSTMDNFEIMFRRVFKNRMKRIRDLPYKTDAQLAQAILKSRGIDGESDLVAVKEFDSFKMDVLIRFILENCNFEKILIAIDNMDDCNADVRDLAFSFAQILSDCVLECDPIKSQNICIVVPLRRYTNISTDTEAYPKVDIPKIRTEDIMSVKIDHARALIDKNYKTKIKALVISTDFRSREIVASKGGTKTIYERHLSGKWFQISSVSSLLKDLMRKTTLKKKHGMLDFIDSLSAGNLKLVTKNTYNMCHSCKLNLTEMVKYVYTSEDNPSWKDVLASMESSSYGVPIIYDLTMAIHYPFYDVDASFIPNIFNAKGSDAPNDFCNTFGLVRLLCYLYNNQPVTRTKLYNVMNSIGYPTSYIDSSLSKALDYCLLNTEFGTRLEHLDDSTIIELSSSGKYILQYSICNHRYLSYVCEDTLMETEYIIPIEDKYTKGDFGGNLDKLHLAVQKLYSFLKKEESNELRFVVTDKGWDRNSFLQDFSIVENGVPITITDYIRKAVKYVLSIDLEKG